MKLNHTKSKKSLYLALALICLSGFSACKKDTQSTKPIQQPPGYDFEATLLNFKINGELQPASIDTSLNTVTIVVADTANIHKLTASVSVANNISAKLNGIALTGSTSSDFSQTASLTLSSATANNTLTFKVNVENETAYFGLGGTLLSQKSLDRPYNFYFDQFDGSTYEAINCGPTVTTMAIKWADSTFSKTPADARAIITENGGWWNTSDVQVYLNKDQVFNALDTLKNIDSLVKYNIDNNNLVIFCLDMYYVPFDAYVFQHTQKFYPTNAAGWGHFLLAKGYKNLSSGFYIDMYDPYSDGEHYPSFDGSQIKGQDRFYLADDILHAASVWWPYTLIVSQKTTQSTTQHASRFEQNRMLRGKPIPVATGR